MPCRRSAPGASIAPPRTCTARLLPRFARASPPRARLKAPASDRFALCARPQALRARLSGLRARRKALRLARRMPGSGVLAAARRASWLARKRGCLARDASRLARKAKRANAGARSVARKARMLARNAFCLARKAKSLAVGTPHARGGHVRPAGGVLPCVRHAGVQPVAGLRRPAAGGAGRMPRAGAPRLPARPWASPVALSTPHCRRDRRSSACRPGPRDFAIARHSRLQMARPSRPGIGAGTIGIAGDLRHPWRAATIGA